VLLKCQAIDFVSGRTRLHTWEATFKLQLYSYLIKRKKWTGGVAQEVEHLRCMYETLSSNSSPTHTQKKAGCRSVAELLTKYVKGPKFDP
jgi:hypothetical protein